MKPNLGLPVVLAWVVVTVGCTAAGPPADAGSEMQLTDDEARAIVERMNEEWDAAVLAGDFEATASMYTEDAIRMQPDIPALVGREAIRTWLESQAATYTFEGSNQILEVRALSPDWILMRGTGAFTATPRGGGEARYQEEKWLTLVQRQADGSWKWYRDAGSSDLPR